MRLNVMYCTGKREVMPLLIRLDLVLSQISGKFEKSPGPTSGLGSATTAGIFSGVGDFSLRCYLVLFDLFSVDLSRSLLDDLR